MILEIEEILSKISISSVHLSILYRGIAALACFFVVWLILKRLLNFIEKRITKYEIIKNNLQIFEIIRKIFFYFLVLTTGTYFITLLEINFLKKAFYAFFIILFAKPVKDFLIIIIAYFKKNVAAKTETKVDDIIFELLNKFADAIIYATAIIIALDVLGINVMPFIAGAGVAGIAIGFAAKDTLSNLIAGVLLIIDRPFEINDRIEVWSAPSGSATWGDVIDIGLRATKIKTTDNIIIIIPNNEIMKRDIVNYTIISSMIRVRVNIGISFESDIEKAKTAILDTVSLMDWVLKSPRPVVVVNDFGESAINLQARVWIKNPRKRIDTISFLVDNVKGAFDRVGVEMPYPKRDIMITNKMPKKTEK